MKNTDNYSNTDLSLEIAYNLMFTNHGEISYMELSTFGDEKNFTLPSHFNQEEEYLKKEAFEKLSKEAKDVINIVLGSPAEILEKFKTSKYNLYSKELLKRYLKEKFNWKKPKMDRVFVELASYTNQL
jgi:hypothetical protein